MGKKQARSKLLFWTAGLLLAVLLLAAVIAAFLVKVPPPQAPVVELVPGYAVNLLAVGVEAQPLAHQEPSLVRSYDFDRSPNTEGWQAVGTGGGVAVTDGFLQVKEGGGGRAKIRSSIDLDTAEVNLVELRVGAPVMTACSLQWRMPTGEWTDGFVGHVTGEGAWRTISFRVGQSQYWNGKIRGLNVNFLGTPEVLRIDQIRLLKDNNPVFVTRPGRVGYAISGERQWVIPTELSGKFARQLDVPEGAILRFACGLSRETWQSHQEEVSFQVFATPEGREQQSLTSVTLRPKALGGKWEWTTEAVDLSDLAGQRGKLSFETSSSGRKSAGVALWGSPTIEPAITRVDRGQPNFLIILVDALRPDHLGVYGYDRPTSPNLDKFAQESIVFENAFSQATGTHLSMGSLFTSLFPLEAKVKETGYFDIRDDNTTLAEHLEVGGYLNAAFNTNALVHWDYGFDRGFDTFFCSDARLSVEELNDKMLQWLESNPRRPFFTYIHYLDVHSPYQPPEKFRSKFLPSDYHPAQPEIIGGNPVSMLAKMAKGHVYSPEDMDYLKALYDGGIAYTDHHIGRLLERLRKMGVYDNTVIIVLADHGEEFLEHGGLIHPSTPYDEVSRVPLIVKLPVKAKRPQERVSATVRLIDVYPTILELAGLPPAQGIRGESLLRVDSAEERWEYAEAPAVRALRGEGWKLIDRPKSNGDELYNLQEDPAEQKNVIKDHPQTATRMRAQMDQLTKPLEPAPSEEEQRQLLDPKTIERLRALGYID